ncbi:Indole-3-glycerol phosphate synthase [Galdieria sulphuraria]|nr:Indole-3-glycerol phosphate synthase [Galdieria sulphuraria]
MSFVYCLVDCTCVILPNTRSFRALTDSLRVHRKRKFFFQSVFLPYQLFFKHSSHSRISVTAEWKPEGLMQNVVEEKWKEVDELQNSLAARKDGPLSLRLQYFAEQHHPHLVKTLKSHRGKLKVVGDMKRTTYGTKPRQKLEIADIINPRKTAQTMVESGVDAISVAVDYSVYSGTFFDLKETVEFVKSVDCECSIPVICKDLVVHPLQIAAAKEAGADAVLLIAAACLSDLPELLNAATVVGLDAIVECHKEWECEYAMEYGATILLLSNRSRVDGEIYMGTAERLRGMIPNFIATIAGGGIETKEEAFSIQDAGFDAVIIGRSLFRPSGMQLVHSIQQRIIEESLPGFF